jgi:hypothetical protein
VKALADLLHRRTGLQDAHGFTTGAHYHVCHLIEAASARNGCSSLGSRSRLLAGVLELSLQEATDTSSSTLDDSFSLGVLELGQPATRSPLLRAVSQPDSQVPSTGSLSQLRMRPLKAVSRPLWHKVCGNRPTRYC